MIRWNEEGTGSCFCVFMFINDVFMFINDLGELLGGVLGARGPGRAGVAALWGWLFGAPEKPASCY